MASRGSACRWANRLGLGGPAHSRLSIPAHLLPPAHRCSPLREAPVDLSSTVICLHAIRHVMGGTVCVRLRQKHLTICVLVRS